MKTTPRSLATEEASLHVVEARRVADPSPVYLSGTDEHPYWTHDIRKARYMGSEAHASNVMVLMYHHLKATKVGLEDIRNAVLKDTLKLTRVMQI